MCDFVFVEFLGEVKFYFIIYCLFKFFSGCLETFCEDYG